MKYTKKLYNAEFTSGRLVRPKNQTLRLLTDIIISPWYLFLFLTVCAFYPTAIFADSFRYLKLQYLRLNSERGFMNNRMNSFSIDSFRNMFSN